MWRSRNMTCPRSPKACTQGARPERAENDCRNFFAKKIRRPEAKDSASSEGRCENRLRIDFGKTTAAKVKSHQAFRDSKWRYQLLHRSSRHCWRLRYTQRNPITR